MIEPVSTLFPYIANRGNKFQRTAVPVNVCRLLGLGTRVSIVANLYAGPHSYSRLAVAPGIAATVGHEEPAAIAAVFVPMQSTVRTVQARFPPNLTGGGDPASH